MRFIGYLIVGLREALGEDGLAAASTYVAGARVVARVDDETFATVMKAIGQVATLRKQMRDASRESGVPEDVLLYRRLQAEDQRREGV